MNFTLSRFSNLSNQTKFNVSTIKPQTKLNLKLSSSSNLNFSRSNTLKSSPFFSTPKKISLFKSSSLSKTNLFKTEKFNFSGSLRNFVNATPNPPIELKTTADAPNDFVNTTDLFKNRKVLLIGIVGAFTGVCDNQLPPYAQSIDEFKQKGIDEIIAVSVNDPSVLKAFSKTLNISPSQIRMLADFDGAFTRSLGMEVDLTTAKLGKRSKRYAMLIEDGKINQQWVEAKPGELKVSSANEVLKHL